MTLKPHEALETIPVGEGTNPKEDGVYIIQNTNQRWIGWYLFENGKWPELGLKTLHSEHWHKGAVWLRPTGQTTEEIRKQAINDFTNELF